MEPYIRYWENTSLENLPNEIWKRVEGFEYYQVSQYGRVKSLSRWIKLGQGRKRKLPEIILKTNAGDDFYVMAGLCENGNKYTKLVHILVASYFVENTNPYLYDEVNHLDGNKDNPYYENLAWTNSSGNRQHAFDIGLQKGLRGEDCPTSKLTNKQIIEIYNSPLPNHELAKLYPVTRKHIWGIKRGNCCVHITGHKK